jgi:hypothetical protein
LRRIFSIAIPEDGPSTSQASLLDPSMLVFGAGDEFIEIKAVQALIE